MREWCVCGGSIRATTRQVRIWRNTHYCPGQPEQPDNGVHISAGAQVENAAQREWDGLEARIGFQREN